VIYADQRWIGDHGIGRFAKHVLAGLQYRPVPLKSHPAAPLDSLRLWWALTDLQCRDIFFSPGYNPPLFCRVPFVFTIHDLGHIHCTESSKAHIHLYYATLLKRACHRAARILTVSEFTRNQIIRWSAVSPEKVLNVGCGVDPAFRPDGNDYGLAFPYLLAVSNRKPHKNENRLVEAFAVAKLDSRIRLVFTGNPIPNLLRLIEALRLGTRVVFVGSVPEEKLPSLYRGAQGLIFPSLYEGFGLPILEAMACGVPVVTSNLTAMPEVAGDAALLVDPRSVERIASAMERIVADSSLRREIISRGTTRAARFSWNGTATKVRDLLGNASHPDRT
jgi:glycosyltransferase involved in cell wall biosynthesis